MTHEEHKQRHIELHKSLDELYADYLMHHYELLMTPHPSIMELLEWSHLQTIDPTPLGKEEE